MSSRLAAAPWWAQAALVWAASRVWAWAVFTTVGRQQGPGPWGDGALGYLAFTGIWDSDWYERIAREGYPGSVPRDEAGRTQENAWAFYPVFPLLVRAVTGLTGAGWDAAASVVSLAAGFGAALLVHRLFLRFAAPDTALWGLAFVAFNPVAPVLQVPYAESLHLALLAGALLLVARGRHLAAAPVVLVMCLTRPAGVPFAAALGITWLVRTVARHRAGQLRRAADAFDGLFALAVFSCAAALAWPAIAWWATGEPTAYTETETVWRGGGLVPVVPWFDAGTDLFGPVAGLAAPVLLVAGCVLVLRSRVVRERLDLLTRVWLASYAVYLLLFLHPQTSTFRLLLPLFPLALPLAAVSDSRAYRVACVLFGAVLQLVWVGWLWHWKQLPGGGDYPP
ncbi:hypothetical protein [Kocuria turfanensis]|uniref:Integral membrane protein n=1 Tax=Kocuria turfanensis TaxID=388357 RepID=A0A512I8B1_9MICC|nr:hypothetical protein [Kocuria turfanensis]GEO93948.1 hypothetical protein KTU01_00710 [Kocuria turfanensis]